MTPSSFEALAREVFGRRYGMELHKITLRGHAKKFDLVSVDGTIVGDAKYFALVRGIAVPPAKWSIIAEHVWLLEKTAANVKFLVFGNDRRVITGWIERFGRLVSSDIEIFFMSDNGDVEKIEFRQDEGISP